MGVSVVDGAPEVLLCSAVESDLVAPADVVVVVGPAVVRVAWATHESHQIGDTARIPALCKRVTLYALMH